VTRRAEHLPFAPPDIGDAEIAAVVETLHAGWLTTGPKVAELERRFAEAVEATACLAVSSCTGALHLALAALGVGRGDAVFVPTMTFAATANVVDHQGAVPVLVDVERDTLNIAPGALERAIASLPAGVEPRAVMPVHYGGHPADLDAVLDVAARHRLAVVEDAAHALPAAVGTTPVGATPDGPVRRAVAFSFYATKNMTTGEGGALVGDAELVDEARLWCLHGMSRDAWGRYGRGGSWAYEVVRPGFKYNLGDVAAAIGLVQLDRLPAFHARRRALVARYREGLGDLDAVELPVERAGVTHAWHLFVIRLDLGALAIDRARFIDELDRRNIGSSVHFIPLHLHPYYRDTYGWKPDDLPVASAEFERIVSLPLHTRMTDADCDDVIEAVRDIVATHRR
jgi:dTDP-4-amino-4,6-dideoxygalactose transaminase